MGSARSYRISKSQLAVVVGATLALWFVIAFTSKAIDAYRLRSWRDRLAVEMQQMERERDALRAELERRQTYGWVDERLRDAGLVPDGVVGVIAVAVAPAPTVAAPTGVEGPAEPPARETASGGLFDNANWEAWQRLIWGFDTLR
ncbi:MAG: hypothetical protein GX657_07915 [Chloroflexi bacterium]|jgi:hypothetical protein|nr:hypothetical protein [Chloroflexota bacterium]